MLILSFNFSRQVLAKYKLYLHKQVFIDVIEIVNFLLGPRNTAHISYAFHIGAGRFTGKKTHLGDKAASGEFG